MNKEWSIHVHNLSFVRTRIPLVIQGCGKVGDFKEFVDRFMSVNAWLPACRCQVQVVIDFAALSMKKWWNCRFIVVDILSSMNFKVCEYVLYVSLCTVCICWTFLNCRLPTVVWRPLVTVGDWWCRLSIVVVGCWLSCAGCRVSVVYFRWQFWLSLPSSTFRTFITSYS